VWQEPQTIGGGVADDSADVGGVIGNMREFCGIQLCFVVECRAIDATSAPAIYQYLQ
jgi:hypothetical protein